MHHRGAHIWPGFDAMNEHKYFNFEKYKQQHTKQKQEKQMK